MATEVGTVTTLHDTASPSEIARRHLQPEQCALVVVDIQEKLLPPIFEKERLIRNAQLLLRLARILDLPVMAATQYTKGLGPVVPEIASLLPSGPCPTLRQKALRAQNGPASLCASPLPSLRCGRICSRAASIGGRHASL
jgi:hypothetical protein